MGTGAATGSECDRSRRVVGNGRDMVGKGLDLVGKWSEHGRIRYGKWWALWGMVGMVEMVGTGGNMVRNGRIVWDGPGW